MITIRVVHDLSICVIRAQKIRVIGDQSVRKKNPHSLICTGYNVSRNSP